jgi:hypothetical protein
MALIIGASCFDSVVFPTPGRPQTITIKAIADHIFLDGNLRYLHAKDEIMPAHYFNIRV